jgi:predicted DNA-binding transcriptional regulator AlpA
VGSSAGRFADLPSLLRWLDAAPAGTTLGAQQLLDVLTPIAASADVCTPAAPVLETPALTWRERIWTVPAETRLGVVEMAEAIGRPKSWVYRHTSAKAGQPQLPHKKLDGELTFVAGEIRTWLRENEETIRPGKSDTPALHLHARRAAAGESR